MYNKETVSKVSVSEVADKLGIELEVSGNYYKAKCPFHKDQKESFVIYDNKDDDGSGIWKCFTEGIYGDSLDLVMKYNKISFSEAIQWIGEEFDLEKRNLSPEERERFYQKNVSLPVLEKATQWFQDNMTTGVYKYLTEERNLSRKMIGEYQIGYAPKEFFKLKQYLYNEGFDDPALIISGLFSRGKSGVYPVFYDRIMIPHKDASGRVIGFSGRAVSETEDVKYVTKNAAFARKRDYIFGIHEAREMENDRVFIVEGVFDVITLRQDTGEIGVAVLGASPDVRHLKMINSYLHDIERVYIAIDGDSPGKKGTARFVNKIYDKDGFDKIFPFDIFVYPTPADKDLDLLLREDKEKFYDLIEESISSVNFLIDYYAEMYKLDTEERKGRFVSACLESISSVNDFSEKFYLEKVAEKAEVSFERIEKEFRVYKTNKLAYSFEEQERLILKYVLENKEGYKKLSEALDIPLKSLLSSRALNILNGDYSDYPTKLYLFSVKEIENTPSFEEALYYARLQISIKLYKIIYEYESLKKENRIMLNRKTDNKIKDLNILFSSNQERILRELQ